MCLCSVPVTPAQAPVYEDVAASEVVLLNRLLEDDEERVKAEHIPEARALLNRLMYVLYGIPRVKQRTVCCSLSTQA